MKFNSIEKQHESVNECKERLVVATLTTMFGEPKFYGSTDGSIYKYATILCKSDPKFVAKLTVFARKVMNLRSVSHVLTCIIAHEAREYTRRVIRNVVIRTDDVTEIMACYATMYGKPFPNAMKREIAQVLKKFNEYQYGKHTDGKIKMRDVFRIVHPIPDSKEMEILFNKVVNQTLETPKTWEVMLSKEGNKAEIWTELLDENKLPYMAALRNLANILKVVPEEDIDPFLNFLTDEKNVKNSKQLPFRYLSAYKTLSQKGLNSKKVSDALDKAFKLSVKELPKFEGRTLIAIDSSSSMRDYVSRNSKITCSEIADTIGVLSSYLCESSTICRFSCELKSSWIHYAYNQSGIDIIEVDKNENLLEKVYSFPSCGGGTDLGLPLHYALEKDPLRHTEPYNRIIYLTDNMSNTFSYGKEQDLLDSYRVKFNPNVIVHMVDLQGYGCFTIEGNNVNYFAGWSERLLECITLAERGMDDMVKIIENYIPF